MTSDKIIRIGGGSAFFIDSALAVPQLLEAGVDYIILDYLAEGAMGLMGRLRMADAGSGFPADFMDVHIGPHLARIAETRTKIVANAGAVNPPTSQCKSMRWASRGRKIPSFRGVLPAATEP